MVLSGLPGRSVQKLLIGPTSSLGRAGFPSNNLPFKCNSLRKRRAVDGVFSFFSKGMAAGSISEKQKVRSLRQDALLQGDKFKCQVSTSLQKQVHSLLFRLLINPSVLCRRTFAGGSCKENIPTIQARSFTSIRKFSSLENDQEPLSISLTSKSFDSKMDFSLSPKNCYALNFHKCGFGNLALDYLAERLMNYNVRELSFAQSRFDSSTLSSLLHACCLGGLRSLELLDVFLSKEDIELLKTLLPSSQICSLRLGGNYSKDYESIKETCNQLNIDCSFSPIQKPNEPLPIEQKATSKKQKVFFSSSVGIVPQGGFNTYRPILTYKDFSEMLPFLVQRVFVNLFSLKSPEGTYNLQYLIFGVACGRGFLLFFNKALDDLPLENLRNGIKEILENPAIGKVFRYFRLDSLILKKYGIIPQGVMFDLALALRVWKERGPFSLQEFAEKRGLTNTEPRQVSSLDPCASLSSNPRGRATAIKFAGTNYRTFLTLERFLKKSQKHALFCKVLLPVEELTAQIWERGVRVDQAFICICISDAKKALNNAEENQKIYEELFVSNDAQVKQTSIFEPFLNNFWVLFNRKSALNESFSRIQNEKDLHIQKLSLADHSQKPWFLYLVEMFWRALGQDKFSQETGKVQDKSLQKMDQKRDINIFLEDLKTKQLDLKNLENILSSVKSDLLQPSYKMRGVLEGIQVSPKLDVFTAGSFFPFLFFPERGTKLVSIRFGDLPLRVLSQITQDPELKKLCKREANYKDLQKAINRKVFGKSEYLVRTKFLNLYILGRVSEKKLKKVLHYEFNEFLGKYLKVFNKVTSLNKRENGSKNSEKRGKKKLTAYKARYLSNLYSLLFSSALSREINLNSLKSRIYFFDKNVVLLSLYSEEEKILRQLAEKVSREVIFWNIPIPIFFEDIEVLQNELLSSSSEPAFLKEITQGTIIECEYEFCKGLEGPAQKVRSLSFPQHVNDQINGVLQRFFNGIELKDLQKEVIANILAGKNVVALLPTGYGKSLCFQIPALISKEITLIISPLISLIENQVIELSEKNIPVIWARNLEALDIENGLEKTKLIYMTPEFFTSHRVLEKLKNVKVSLCVVDEAHCIYEWGSRFRDAYRKLGLLKKTFPRAPILALSATAPPKTVQDICHNLHIGQSTIIRGEGFKKNLFLNIEKRTNLKEQLRDFLLRHVGKAGIIYCQTRREVEKLHEMLNSEGFPCQKYHANMPLPEKTEILKEFLSGNTELIIATVAFGMGINKPNVRFICHTKLPGSLEQYYQEIGRAGRDGLPAECLLLFSDHDFLQNLLLGSDIKDETIRKEFDVKLNQMFFFCQQSECRQKYVASYFSNNQVNEICGNCDICLNKIEIVDGTKIIQNILQSIILTNGSLNLAGLCRFLCGEDIGFFKPEHKYLSTFGCLSMFLPSDVRSLLRYMLQKKYVSAKTPELDLNNSGYFVCNAQSYEILKGTKKVFIQKLLPSEGKSET